MRVLLINLISLLLLSGCFSSSYLTSIGAKAKHGKINSQEVESNLSVPIIDSKRYPGFWPIPAYVGLVPSPEGIPVGEANFNIEDIKWQNPKETEGLISITVNGEVLDFIVERKDERLTLKHNYRKWYSYPLQSLLIITVPVDIVIGVAVGVVTLVIIPFS